MSAAAIHLRVTNASILVSVIALTLTGLYGLMWPMPAWMFDLHRITAWALTALTPWKLLITWGSLKRGLDRRFKRSVVVLASLLLVVFLVTVMFMGMYWTWNLGPGRLLWYQTAISWHWYLALALLAPLAFHVWQRWPRPRRSDFSDRRSALKLMGVGAAGLALWGVSETLAVLREDPQTPRTSSGSREEGSFTGLGYPVNMMVGEGKMRLDPETWRFVTHGRVAGPLTLDYEQILALPKTEQVATLDCTDGWYTTQHWQGVRLVDLLKLAEVPQGALGFSLNAASGYSAYFTIAEADEILLATHSGDQVFDHWHGFPLRAVVPSRRGWQWVKWLVDVQIV
jgi:hypothetical protein